MRIEYRTERCGMRSIITMIPENGDDPHQWKGGPINRCPSCNSEIVAWTCRVGHHCACGWDCGGECTGVGAA